MRISTDAAPFGVGAGFCAPSMLELSLLHSGGRLGSHHGDRAAGSGSRPSSKAAAAAGGSATQQVLVSAAFWLDNRSGVNLVLSDLDRRVLKGLPGPGLRSEWAGGLKEWCIGSPGNGCFGIGKRLVQRLAVGMLRNWQALGAAVTDGCYVSWGTTRSHLRSGNTSRVQHACTFA
jgi:hypothetical protein